MTEENLSESAVKSDNRYFLIVGVLLLVIIAALASLWLLERSRRLQAENDLSRITHDYSSLKTVMDKYFLTSTDRSATPVRRDDLLVRQMEVDGKFQQAFYISPSAGKRFGFEPGDLILVGQEPTTQPE